MTRLTAVLLALCLLMPAVFFFPAEAWAKKCESCPRDAHGKIQRSSEAKKEFLRESGYPHGRKGYVVDHIVPLACGGSDDPSNMQWQSKAEAKAKDKIERKTCTR